MRLIGSPGGRAGLVAILLLSLAAASLHSPPPARAQETPSRGEPVLDGDLPVVEAELANGMRVLVLRRTTSPTVAFVVRYDVGGVNEHRGITGIAHLLEHMLFKGTTTVGTRNLEGERELFGEMDALQDRVRAERARHHRADTARIRTLEARIEALEDSARTFVVSNEFDRILSRAGARGLNATTDMEATTYMVELPANRVKLWFTLEADRMAHPVFREFYAERDVVMEERRTRVENDPGGLLYERHLAAAFPMHPYGQPVAGYMSDLRGLTRPRVRAYFRDYYGPRNATVAIVGDVDPDSVLALARAYFGPLPPGEPAPPVLAEEPEQRGERRITVRFDAEPRVRIGWRVPDAFHPDAPALTVLSSLLTGGRTSRLHRRLVQKERLATFVSSAAGPGARFQRLFTVDAVPRAPHTTEEVEAAVYREMERLTETPPDEDELIRVRNQLQAARVRRLRSNLGLALQLAGSESLWGDWRTTFELNRRLAEVTAEDVQRVAREYFLEENRTVATLCPEEGP